MFVAVARLVYSVSAIGLALLLSARAIGRALSSGGEIAFTLERDGRPGIAALDVGRGIFLMLARNGTNPVWSPDGRRIAFETAAGNHEVYVMDADSGNLRNLTRHDGGDYSPVWSPDGRDECKVVGRKPMATTYIMMKGYDCLLTSVNHRLQLPLCTTNSSILRHCWALSPGSPINHARRRH